MVYKPQILTTPFEFTCMYAHYMCKQTVFFFFSPVILSFISLLGLTKPKKLEKKFFSPRLKCLSGKLRFLLHRKVFCLFVLNNFVVSVCSVKLKL